MSCRMKYNIWAFWSAQWKTGANNRTQSYVAEDVASDGICNSKFIICYKSKYLCALRSKLNNAQMHEYFHFRSTITAPHIAHEKRDSLVALQFRQRAERSAHAEPISSSVADKNSFLGMWKLPWPLAKAIAYGYPTSRDAPVVDFQREQWLIIPRAVDETEGVAFWVLQSDCAQCKKWYHQPHYLYGFPASLVQIAEESASVIYIYVMPKALSSPAQQIVVPGIVQLSTYYNEINLPTKWCVHAYALYNVGCCMAHKDVKILWLQTYLIPWNGVHLRIIQTACHVFCKHTIVLSFKIGIRKAPD